MDVNYQKFADDDVYSGEKRKKIIKENQHSLLRVADFA